MRTRVVLLPGALEEEGQAPLFENEPAAIARMRRRGELFRVRTRFPGFEAEWLGLETAPGDLSQGVLTVAALGADPPERSTHFHLSLLSTDGDSIQVPEYVPEEQELEAIWSQARRLETSLLKLVKGRALDHGLVWEEGSLDLACRTREEAATQGFRPSLPEGDGEQMLRRFIDDSVNLLTPLELNRERLEEGLRPLNLLWPWGPGFRPKLPNLTVERGTSVEVASPSLRLRGLCRMAGYRHVDPWSIGDGTNLRLEAVAEKMESVPVSLAALTPPGAFRSGDRQEEASWLGREIGERLLSRLMDFPEQEPRKILLVATQQNGVGLGLEFSSERAIQEISEPFTAESAAERRLAVRDLGPLIREALTWR
jgi:2,3-bisphosphoglycerate-independent phosphoglycerate mutase